MNIVLFTGGEAPEPSDALDFFTDLGDVGFTVAADSGLDTLERYNSFFGDNRFAPSHVIGDMDSVEDRCLLGKYGEAKIIPYPADKDFSDTELGLELCRGLRKSSDDTVVMVGGNGGRCDHFISIYETFSTESHCDIWLCGAQVVYYLGQGESVSVTGLGERDCLSIARIPGFFDRGSVESDGLEWGSGVMRKKGMPSLSNRISKDHREKNLPVELRAVGAPFLVFLPLTAKVL